ncbi:MAG: hypothetical protein KDI42_06680 [Gammaproteobacteria bacterium]|nr:hypothetical protein [Gammaproteobacteria bacterium]
MTSFALRAALPALLTLTLSGCGSSLPRYPEAQVLPPAPLPSYQVGDLYLFDDGYIEKVVAVEGDLIDWESYGGLLNYRAHRNFAMPREMWDSELGHGEASIAIPPDTLWPLQAGNRTEFFSHLEVTDKLNHYTRPFDQRWQCHVAGTRRVSVPAGEFDTWEIGCARSTAVYSNRMQERRWYYAPSVGHYVLREDMFVPLSNRPLTYIRHALVAYLPSDAALSNQDARAAERHFQLTLDTAPSGETRAWENSDKSFRREIRVLNSFRTEDDRFCREFTRIHEDRGRLRRANGIACRGKGGEWRLAVLDVGDNPYAKTPGTSEPPIPEPGNTHWGRS